MQKEICFIFIDESLTIEIDTASLTGVVISLHKFEKVRKDFYKIIKKIISYLFPDGLIVDNQPPPTLHAKDFLRNSTENPGFDFSNVTDDFRFIILNDIVDLVNDNNLFIVRQGYNNVKEILNLTLEEDNKLHQLNWFNISRTISYYFNNTMFIPVMEGIDRNIVDNFCQLIWRTVYYTELYPDIAKSLTYNKSNTFISPVFFTMAKFTEGIQIADVVSYLLQKVDYINTTDSKSVFSQNLKLIASRINNDNLINYIGKLNHKY